MLSSYPPASLRLSLSSRPSISGPLIPPNTPALVIWIPFVFLSPRFPLPWFSFYFHNLKHTHTHTHWTHRICTWKKACSICCSEFDRFQLTSSSPLPYIFLKIPWFCIQGEKKFYCVCTMLHPLSVDGHLGWFDFLTTVSSKSANMAMHAFMCSLNWGSLPVA